MANRKQEDFLRLLKSNVINFLKFTGSSVKTSGIKNNNNLHLYLPPIKIYIIPHLPIKN